MLRSMLALAFVFLLGCKHKTEIDCEQRPKDEDNCKSCASLTECGWCGQPVAGQTSCQPAASADMPSSCTGEWTHNEAGCPAPPLPPDAEKDIE